MIRYQCDACKRSQEAEWIYSSDFKSWSHMPPQGWGKAQGNRRVGCSPECVRAINIAYEPKNWRHDTEDQTPISDAAPAASDVRGR